MDFKISTGWRLLRDVEGAFDEFLRLLVAGDGQYFFQVCRTERHHRWYAVWVDWLVRTDRGESELQTKGLHIELSDLQVCVKNRTAALLVIQELCRRPWVPYGMYQMSPTPDTFELPHIEEVGSGQ
jgi:hypothetical protein